MVSTEIKEVQIFKNGCTITRVGSVHLKEGTQKIRISGLPESVINDSVRLSVTEGVSGSNVQVLGLSKEEKEEITLELSEKIAELETSINLKENLCELWSTNADFSGRDGISIVDMTQYLEMIPERLEKLQKEIKEQNKELKKLREELQKKQKEANKSYVSADVIAEKEGDYPIQIKFFANCANWYPKYELHTDDENEEILIRLKACVNQNTDEDWKQVKVILLTGDPSISGTIPELYPRYLNIYEPKPVGARMLNGFAKDARVVYEEECVMEESVTADNVVFNQVYKETANVNKEDTMMEYELIGKWDILKGEEFLCDISSNKLSCKYHVVTIPKVDEAAYLAAEVETTDIEDLLNTSAAVYHHGAYLGEVYLQPDTTKDKYDISLGRDDSIKVSRKNVKKHTSTNAFKTTKKTEFAYEIKINSTKLKDCEVTVIDQIPISQDKSIVVDNKNISGGKFEEKSGQVKWEFTLEPSTTKTLQLEYDVSWPKDKNINL